MKIVDYSEMRKLFNEEYLRTMQLVRDGETHLDNLAEGFLEADRVIERLPEVDAVPVVRCKDCVYRRLTGKAPFMFYTCSVAEGLNVCKSDAFCSYGERRADHD